MSSAVPPAMSLASSGCRSSRSHASLRLPGSRYSKVTVFAPVCSRQLAVYALCLLPIAFRLLFLLKRVEHLLRRDRESLDSYPHGVEDRIADHRGGRVHAELAESLGAERPRRLVGFRKGVLQRGHIAHRGNPVVGKVRIDRPSILHLQAFDQGVTEPLRHGALYLDR